MNDEKRQRAIVESTEAVECLMAAVRDMVVGKALENPEVQEQIGWAIRKLLPLCKGDRYGARRMPIEAS